MKEACADSAKLLNQLTWKECQTKTNQLKNCDEKEDSCDCDSGGGSKGKVDLVLLIDSSGSMGSKAAAVNAAAGDALDEAKRTCEADVRTVWLYVDGLRPGSASGHNLGANAGNYTESHQVYLEGIGAAGPFFHDAPDPGASYLREQGADAIADIAKFFDWRADACRSIFYVSDTTLEGVGSNSSDNDNAKTQAISVAVANNVTVFAHRSDIYNATGGMTAAECDKDYQELCSATGGFAAVGGAPTQTLYVDLISKAICDCGGGCKEADFPELKPCFSISWGDSECDGMESDDFEVLCITACNCYSNVIFENLSISLVTVLDERGDKVVSLPDGTPSVQAVPAGGICFGDLGPCVDGVANCLSRQFAIKTSGAKPGKYQVRLDGICYTVAQSYHESACFEMAVCKS